MSQHPRFIVVDGITGSGKSTIIRAMKSWAEERGHRIFDLSSWCQDHSNLPRFDELEDVDMIFTFEPTKSWVGATIRYEMSRTDDPYSGHELAEAFALDRLVQYKRLIIPALRAGKIIVQDRSVSTSIAYQPIMPGGPSLEHLLALAGNALALKHPPHELILTNLPAKIAVDRLNARPEISRGVFHDQELLERIDERFKSDWFTELFSSRGTRVHHFNADVPKENMQRDAYQLIQSILKQR